MTFVILVSTFGVISITGLIWAGGGILATAFGLATRLVFGAGSARCLGFFSNKNSTPNSGFSSVGGSGAGFDTGLAVVLEAGGSGFIAALALTVGLNSLMEANLAIDFALATAGITNSGDRGAALALAIDFLGTIGFGGSTGFTSGTGLLTSAAFVFMTRLRLIGEAGLAFAAFGDFLTFLAAAVFLTARFFGAFAAFKVFALVLVRVALARRADGFAAVVFFGFFMATVSRRVARVCSEIKPGISRAQR